MTAPNTPLAAGEELEKEIRWILDTRHTVPAGQSHTDTYAPRLAKWFAQRERAARLDELERLLAHPHRGGLNDTEVRVTQRIVAIEQGTESCG